MGSAANASFQARGGRWVVAQSVLLLALVAAGPLDQHCPGLVATISGEALFLAGALLGLAGVKHLGRNRTPYPQPLAEAQLVTTGAYRLVRHPLYGSLLLAGLGWACLWHSPSAYALAAVNTVFFVLKANQEERWLREKFPEYAAYARRTRRFIPWLW